MGQVGFCKIKRNKTAENEDELFGRHFILFEASVYGKLRT